MPKMLEMIIGTKNALRAMQPLQTRIGVATSSEIVVGKQFKYMFPLCLFTCFFGLYVGDAPSRGSRQHTPTTVAITACGETWAINRTELCCSIIGLLTAHKKHVIIRSHASQHHPGRRGYPQELAVVALANQHNRQHNVLARGHIRLEAFNLFYLCLYFCMLDSLEPYPPPFGRIMPLPPPLHAWNAVTGIFRAGQI